jgi:predicted nuclease of predicted toxin-antitoxin system
MLEKSMPDQMRLYLDQCLRVEVSEILRAEGFDVIRASEVGQSRADDFEILQYAIAEKRILITLDDHFGNWVILPLREHPGVIRLKVHPTTAENAVNLLLPFLRKHGQIDFQNQLVILSENKSRWIYTGQ